MFRFFDEWLPVLIAPTPHTAEAERQHPRDNSSQISLGRRSLVVGKLSLS
jgi:hypothetical protein